MEIDFTPKQAAEKLGLTPSGLAGRRWKDRGDNGDRSPAWIEVGGRCQGYTEEAIQEWLDRNTVGAK